VFRRRPEGRLKNSRQLSPKRAKVRAGRAHPIERTCIGCGQKKPKALLRRMVLGEDGGPVYDRAQVAAGRGAYLCGPGCLAAAVKRKAFGRAFRGMIGGGSGKFTPSLLEAVFEVV
jgi:predicted RNA-binding protein YlxR (DUF448 family)